MTTQPHEGGRRPIDRVLAPGFTDDLASLSLVEVRDRRHQAEQEEVDLSYARRLLQGRLDLLRAEQAGRSGSPRLRAEVPRSDEALARDLAVVLADDQPRQDHGLGRHLVTDPSRVGEHRRAAEQAVHDLQASDPSQLDADELTTAIARLADLEHAVSGNRHRVQMVMDQFTAEITRRYRDGEARVDDVLAAEVKHR
ncbi:MAG: aerial mycelium formation protein [Angustibacter sp.]